MRVRIKTGDVGVIRALVNEITRNKLLNYIGTQIFVGQYVVYVLMYVHYIMKSLAARSAHSFQHNYSTVLMYLPTSCTVPISS